MPESARDRRQKRLERQIVNQKHALDLARQSGDPLRIELAETALDDLLGRLSRLLHVTTQEGVT